MQKQSPRNRLLSFGVLPYIARRGVKHSFRIEKFVALQTVLLAMTCFLAASGTADAAYTTASPEVRQAVEKAVKFLESAEAKDERIGAKALIGLTLVKFGCKPDHPKIVETAGFIQKAMGNRDPAKLDTSSESVFNIYATGICIIYFVQLDPVKYRPEIECLLKSLRMRQKKNGAWGYPDSSSGDTSMTQYGVLSSWEAEQAGFAIPIESIENVVSWLMRTQDPSGGFGYQGMESKETALMNQTDVNNSMSAAGMGSVYICSTLLGMVHKAEKKEDGLPSSLKEIKSKDKDSPRVKTRIDPTAVRNTQALAVKWFEANYKIDPPGFTSYYLYALERAMSFREYVEQKADPNSQWYTDGAQYLIKTQAGNGSWNSNPLTGPVCDTAFSTLFLLRSTKKSIEHAVSFGAGTMVGGRGLPMGTGDIRGGKGASKAVLGSAEKLLAALDNPKGKDFDESVNLLADMPAENVGALPEEYRARIRSLVGAKSADARLAAVKALGKARSLDNVDALIYALTDPDPLVVREAHEALLRTARSPTMIRLPDNPTPEDVRSLIDKWKAWYRAIRPNANLDFQ
jgi:hypothetical protein